MTRVPVNGGVFFAGGGGLSARVLLPIGLGLVGGLLGHGAEKKVTRPVSGVRSQVSGKETTVGFRGTGFVPRPDTWDLRPAVQVLMSVNIDPAITSDAS